VNPRTGPARIFGITGGRGEDKIALLDHLIPELSRRGVTVSTVKYINHPFDIDRPGKDSYRHREAGAREVLVLSRHRWAMLHENPESAPPDLDDLIAHMSPVDLVIAIGFRDHPHDRLEIGPSDHGKRGRSRANSRIVALAGDSRSPSVNDLPDAPPFFDLGDVHSIADFIVAHCGFVPSGGSAP
jgi:molybdopterin-guanine dinucleotide biosynthesis protein B